MPRQATRSRDMPYQRRAALHYGRRARRLRHDRSDLRDRELAGGHLEMKERVSSETKAPGLPTRYSFERPPWPSIIRRKGPYHTSRRNKRRELDQADSSRVDRFGIGCNWRLRQLVRSARDAGSILLHQRHPADTSE